MKQHSRDLLKHSGFAWLPPSTLTLLRKGGGDLKSQGLQGSYTQILNIFFSIFLLIPVFASPVTQLTQALLPLKSFSANFTQSVVLQKGAEPQRSTGQVDILDHHVRWQVNQPQKQLYITDGKTLWQIDFFLEQVTIRPLSQQVDSAPILLLSGDTGALSQDFEIQTPDANTFVLTPKKPDSEINQVTLSFRHHRLVSLELHSALGQSTTLVFTQMQGHPHLSLQDFQVKIPAGFDVMDEREPPNS